VSLNFLRQLARLSWSDEGPRLPKEFLASMVFRSLSFPICRELNLDGAALKVADGTPVIGLTLCYDRVDNFWFCLLHELAHVGRHMERDGATSFVDDLSLRNIEACAAIRKRLRPTSGQKKHSFRMKFGRRAKRGKTRRL
jgi:HTH-type transcriptional regulator / antitoxin HigA